MDIESSSSLFFPSFAKGIVLNDAYDLYKRNRYIEYVKKNQINLIQCQDLDMSLLSFFSNIEFLYVPKDAINLENLYQLKKLRGIKICANELDKINLDYFENLEWLEVYEEPKNLENICKCKKLANLECCMWKSIDFSKMSKFNAIKKLNIVFWGKLISLNGIEYLNNLEELVLDYCLKLKDIGKLRELAKNLRVLNITDCNMVENLNILGEFERLEDLKLTTFETRCVNKLESIKFVNNMKKLKNFMTDYKIVDGDLTPLKKVENVQMLKIFRHYKNIN